MQLVVKSQILAGGRGLGTFKNGLKGGVHIVKRDEVEDIAGLWIFSNSTTLHHVHISVIPILVDVGRHLLHSISVFFLVLNSKSLWRGSVFLYHCTFIIVGEEKSWVISVVLITNQFFFV